VVVLQLWLLLSCRRQCFKHPCIADFIIGFIVLLTGWCSLLLLFCTT
jgi:hypothetical protein